MTSSLGLAAYALLFALFAIGAWLRPSIAIAALACLFGLKQLGEASHAWLATHAIVTNFAVAAVVVLAVVRRVLQRKISESPMPAVYWLVVVFFVYAFLSVAWTPALTPALNMWGHDIAYIFLLVLVAPWLANTDAELHTAFSWLTYAGGFLIVALLFTARWGDRGLLLSSGALDETNPLAIADVSGVVAVAALFIVPVRLRALAWIARLSIAAVCVIAIVRSGSRGQLVATSISVVLMLPVAYPVNRLRSVGAALVALAVVGGAVAWGVASYVHLGDDRWLRTTASSDMHGRWAMVGALLNAWSQQALTIFFGVGNSGSFSPSIAGFYPHNVPLEILGEEGLVGFAMYMLLVSCVVAAAFRGVRSAGEDLVRRGILAATLGCFLFAFLVSLKQGNAIGSVTLFMFLVLACRAAAQRDITETKGAEVQSTRLWPVFPNLLR